MKYFSNREFLGLKDHERVENIKDASVFIVVGGDGTMIDALHYLAQKEAFHVKLLGVNTGHVGFLSNDIDMDQLRIMLNEADDGWSNEWSQNYVTNRSLIEVRNKFDCFYGINEVVVSPSRFGRLFTVEVLINDIPITYSGDGLIVSTASGSTAYNLSAGGPIVAPDVDAMCITPLNPFSLASRPLVVNKNTIVKIRPRAEWPNITIDGRIVEARDIELKISNKEVSLIKVNSFMGDIQDKLGWNRNIKYEKASNGPKD